MGKSLQPETPTAATSTEAPFAPEFTSSQRGTTHPTIPASKPFVLVFFPSRWTLLDNKLVPALAQYPLEAGANHIEETKDHRFRMARFRTEIEEQGGTLIPFEWGPNGSYMKKVLTRPLTSSGRISKDPVNAFIPSWSSAHIGDSRVYPDVKAYAAWLRSLIDQGKLPECEPHKARVLLSKARMQLARAEAREERKPTAAGRKRIQNLTQRIDVLEGVAGDKPVTPEAASSTVTPPEAPEEPTTKRTGRKS